MTPLGVLVEPLVNCKNARSDGLRSAASALAFLFDLVLIASMTIHVKFSGHATDLFLKRVTASLRALGKTKKGRSVFHD